jgi:hypothetical protein
MKEDLARNAWNRRLMEEAATRLAERLYDQLVEFKNEYSNPPLGSMVAGIGGFCVRYLDEGVEEKDREKAGSLLCEAIRSISMPR